MVPVRTPPSALTKLIMSTCGIVFVGSEPAGAGAKPPFGTIRTSPRPTLPDLNSNVIDPARPVASLEYSPTHFPVRASMPDLVPPTATVGAGFELDDEEQAGAPAMTASATEAAAT